jgi:TPR repeat protein
MYNHGSGVEKDEEEALFWYHHAAESGNENAQNYLRERSLRQ